MPLRRFAPIPLPPTFPRVLMAGGGTAIDQRYRYDVDQRLAGYATLQISLSGAGIVEHPGPTGPVREPIPAGTCLIFRAGEAGVRYGHPGASRPPWRFIYAELGGDAALQMAGDVIAARGRVVPIDVDRPAVRSLIRLVGGRSDPVHLPAAASCELACGLLALLGEPERQPRAGREALAQRAAAWLGERLDQPVGVGQAAEALGVSREHLTRSFARCFGITPGSWLTHQRLARGEQLLRETRLSVRAVTAACGLADPGHFASTFTRRFGVGPADYRRRLGPQAIQVRRR
jgi:AraC-like DNA-binding protein